MRSSNLPRCGVPETQCCSQFQNFFELGLHRLGRCGAFMNKVMNTGPHICVPYRHMMCCLFMQVTLLENGLLCRSFVCVYAFGLSLMTIDTIKWFYEKSLCDTGLSLLPYACRSDLSLKLFNLSRFQMWEIRFTVSLGMSYQGQFQWYYCRSSLR